MDIISYSKAMKAKKRITEVNKRLGKGDNKSGEKDIIDVHGNTRIRLEELEKKRLGLLIKKTTINTEAEFKRGNLNHLSVANNRLVGAGTWERIVDLGENALEFDRIEIKTAHMNPSVNTKIPNMTADNLPSPWAATTNSGSNPYKVYNDDVANNWTSIYNVMNDVWVQLDLGEGNKKRISKYDLSTPKINETSDAGASQMPSLWRIEGSNDALSWSVLDTQSATKEDWGGIRNQNTPFTKSCMISSPQEFRFYRIYFVSIVGGAWARQFKIGSLSLYESAEETYDYFENDFTGVVVETDTGQDYKKLDINKVPTSEFKQALTLKVTLDGTRELSEISVNYKVPSLLNRVSDLEKNTNINLNKHNLRVDTILNKRRYKLKEMIVDDFEDASGIDMLQSVNIIHDAANHKIKQTDASKGSTLVTVKETLEAAPTMFSLSAVVNDMATITRDIDFASGTLIDTIMNGEELEMKPVALDEYKKSATWESSVIDLGTGFTRIVRFDKVVDIPTGTGLKMFTSSSVDGLTFEEYREVNSDGTIASSSRRYFKVKAEFASKEEVQPPRTIHDFASVEAANFIANDKIILDGSAKLKTTYSQAMIPVDGYVESGSLLKTTIGKTMFKSIEKVEVK